MQAKFPHRNGRHVLNYEAVAIDSGGHFTQKVYEFSAKHMRLGRRWHAIRGVPGEKRLLWTLSKEAHRMPLLKLYLVGVDDGKTMIYKRYGIKKPGPGYVHLHDKLTDAHLQQLTAERAEVEYVDGFPKRVWTKPRGRRNEMLDMLVYNTAVKSSLNLDLASRFQALNAPETIPTLDAEAIGRLYK